MAQAILRWNHSCAYPPQTPRTPPSCRQKNFGRSGASRLGLGRCRLCRRRHAARCRLGRLRRNLTGGKRRAQHQGDWIAVGTGNRNRHGRLLFLLMMTTQASRCSPTPSVLCIRRWPRASLHFLCRCLPTARRTACVAAFTAPTAVRRAGLIGTYVDTCMVPRFTPTALSGFLKASQKPLSLALAEVEC